MINTDFLNELDRFSFMIRKRVSTIYSGTRRSIKQGRGVGIVGYREYMPGDDIKSIDWRVYARSEKLFIRQFEEEKNVTAHILLDASRSMDYGEPRKFDYAAMLAVGFAYLITKENEKFAISTFSEDINISEAKRGMDYLMRTIDYLNSLELEGKTSFGACLEKYSKVITSKSLVIVISDMLTDIESIRHGLFSMAQNSLIVIQVLDRQEWDMNIGGDVKLFDLESGSAMKTYISPRLKEEYLSRLNMHINQVNDACSQLGAEFYTLRTDESIFNAFVKIMSRVV
ncbi:MAG TPA: DUF58 domain-containing protein [Candidatus Methanoperedenaceae archaeon]|nr:DUF58 domain-containing protein [Candidatus Methanoperedenaceae archaeon]